MRKMRICEELEVVGLSICRGYENSMLMESLKARRRFAVYGGDDLSLKDKAKKLKRDIPAVFLALKRKDTPMLAKVFGAVTVGYALSPIDLVPDFVPVLGYLDDVILLPLLVALTLKFIPKNIFDECKEQAEGMWDNGKPKKWYYAIPMVLVWGVLIYLIIKLFV